MLGQVPCVSQALNFTTCAVSNLTSACLCYDKPYISVLRSCVRAACDLDQAYREKVPFPISSFPRYGFIDMHISHLLAKNVTWTRCGFPYHHQTGTVAGRVSLVVGTALFVVVRLLAKVLRLSSWGPDDVTLMIGYFFSLGFAISKFHGSFPQISGFIVHLVADTLPGFQLGIGRDVWALSYDEITRFMQVFFAFEVIYTLSISALKASILFFYIRVFSMVSSTFTMVLWATQAFNLAFCIAFTVANLNQCRPFSNAWEAWDGKHPGYCINVYAMFISHAAINIALDVWMLVLPVTQILWLNLRKRQKAEIVAMFGLGVFITIVSAIRLRVLISLEGFKDPTYDAFYLHMWSYIELSVGVVVACLPSTRQLWRHLVPKLLRFMGLGSPLHQNQARHEDSTRRLKDILFISTTQDKAIPAEGTGSADAPSSYRTRSG
ncbi:CFEM domain-containing protein [Colletotrichum higginsianum IMI 349063]|uniref:CFEM domain-containing protein n=1 Tax=Colletotrichum higginsianum (strain IMI 349063) TaxID=759273 RepID=A0A1B7YKN4_COLHI|nr:CFEM domain-containing protein [Colletotrichum higginsianum IMI 349063]OBR12633.1 CFEM domain-containing protein [Colletotrichum higginsianum IMI 349063]